MADQSDPTIQQSLNAFRQAHRKGMEALHSSDSERIHAFGIAITEERRAIEDFWIKVELRQEAFSKRLADWRKHPSSHRTVR
jgi:hypothetical protein